MPTIDERAEPRDEYARRLEERRALCERLDERDRLVAYLRAAVFLATAVAVWLAFGRDALPPAVPVGGGLLFLVLVVVHARILDARARGERAVAYYRRGLARIAERPEPPARDDAGLRFADGVLCMSWISSVATTSFR
jgi:hypothetical protein